MMLRRLVSLLLLSLALFASAPGALAQTPLPVASLQVDLWPEFDRPTMLVMYQITLSPLVRLPSEVRLRIPAAAGAPHAVAVCQPGGDCFNTPFEQQAPLGEWSTLLIQATLPDLRVEYYDPRLFKDGAQRTFTYRWPGDLAVDNFRLKVQRPPSASAMTLKPGMASVSLGADDLTYYTVDVGAVPEGREVILEIAYQKANDDLTSSAMPLVPSEPLGEQNTAPRGLPAALPLILGVLGVGLIAGGGLWYYLSGRQKERPTARAHHARRPSRQSAAVAEEGYIYCPQCGYRAEVGDRFCRRCGSALRER